MGGAQAKLSYRSAFVELTNKTQPIDANNDEFWDQFWSDCPTRIRDIFVLVPASEIRALREESPSNLATLCYKAVERLAQIAEASFPTAHDQQTALNCIRLLTRIIPYIFEDAEWRAFFWSALPQAGDSDPDGATSVPLAQTLVSSLCDLLFCPDFTVHSMSKPGPEGPEDMHTIDSCEYIWESGVGFAQSHPPNFQHDSNRTEILRLLLVCFSETMYLDQSQARTTTNRWISFFTGPDNRHVLPLFTSLLNILCAYNPVSSSLPYNHLVFTDSREPLVEVALQVLCVALETDLRALEVRNGNLDSARLRRHSGGTTSTTTSDESSVNLFVNYMSRIHRDEDFSFILTGLARLLNNPLTQTYLPGSAKKVQMHQELLILFWRMCDVNKKFMFYVLKSSRVLDILVPILYYLNEARSDKSQLGLMHIGVFIILLLSGERNFGVRLNKPYTNRVPMDITVFTGNHADLLIIVFHKIITTGHSGLQPLFDCLITIIDNVSPYVKSLSMVSANKLVHLTEAFSQPWFLFSAPNNYQLVLFLLEVFNNIIQYQFDGNSCLIYTIIRKRHVFYNLANLPHTDAEIREILSKHGGNRRFDYADDTDVTQTAAAATLPTVSEASRLSAADTPPKVENPMENTETTAKPSEVSLNGTERPLLTDDGEKAASEHSAAAENEAPKQTQDPAQLEVGAFQASLLGTPDFSSMTDHQLADQRGAKPATLDSHHSDGVSFEDLHSHETPNSPSVEVATTTDFEPRRGEEKDTVVVPDTAAHQPSPSAQAAPLSSTLNLSFGPVADSASSQSIVVSQPSVTSTPQQPASSKNSDILRVGSPPSQASDGVRKAGASTDARWRPTSRWVADWQPKLPLQTIMRLLQVLVPQVEKICIEKGLTDESEVLKFLQNGTLVGLLPVPHPILIRKYQSNFGTAVWFRTYIWGVIYLRNLDPPIWYDTNVRLFEVQPI
uniref:Protein HID1 n=2 Tax=Schistocephalus solidus TaxID=70667 RepID=A0A0V0J6K1_SCHSO